MSPLRATTAVLCLLAAAALVMGCGGGSSTSDVGQAASKPAPPKSDFPSAAGRTLRKVMKAADGPSELIVSPAATVFYRGENRFPFYVSHKDRSQIANVEVALYFAKAPAPTMAKGGKEANAEAGSTSPEATVIGPFPAAIESLATRPAFRARTTTSDPNAASVVYVTNVDLPSNGQWRIAALIKQGKELTATLVPSVMVGEFSKVRRVGERAPLIHTPTPSGVGGDLSKITTRVPPDTQNQVDYADVFGKKPIVLLFATPKFCQSRVCGPVVDVAEQVKKVYGNKAAFIHMEIYRDNEPSKGLRPQVKAFHLPSEPWLFAIDRHGIIRAEIEGAFGVDALTQIVKAVTE